MTKRGSMRGAAARDLAVVRRARAARPAPIPAPRSWRRARARRRRACARPRRARPAPRAASKPASRNTAPISASQTSPRIAAFLRPPPRASPSAHQRHAARRPSFRDFRAGLAPHQPRQPHRQIALARLGIRLVEHLRDDDPEHAVAEKLQPLIGLPAPPPLAPRGNMGQRAARPAPRRRRRGRAAPPAPRVGFGRLGRACHRGGASVDPHEQPVPADRPRPAPELPGRRAVADREEDDLRAADQVLRRHIADRRRRGKARILRNCRGCRPS